MVLRRNEEYEEDEEEEEEAEKAHVKEHTRVNALQQTIVQDQTPIENMHKHVYT